MMQTKCDKIILFFVKKIRIAHLFENNPLSLHQNNTKSNDYEKTMHTNYHGYNMYLSVIIMREGFD